MTDATPSGPANRGATTSVSRFRMARGSAAWLLPAWGATAAAIVAARRSRTGRLLALPAVGASCALTWFFRDPVRTPPPQGILSAADGTVQSVEDQGDGRTRIAVFMSPLNVHVNRSPLPARVREQVHHPGGYRPAFDKDSERNERVVWTLETERGPVTLVQIAGALVRRIVPYVRPGASVSAGQRIGLIRFGSRVDVYLPVGVEPAVQIGQRVRAGETRLDRD
ncbi:phosphatidylserine decarboxylase [Lipingzhangella sp. LS1_29]|uniref:Phosphatidylserine decarboxylase n=1 Tax=Lipingzhangella rawalii TaxID=2055835 RepID=A0ABU2H217_9ACTN|nr:phosphatidylserine decarboxylase [Lipingzhangella rawalii]MDS1268865.1 phosphatidylserine decarboxylase [Lipingzhangella rawalii]